MGKTDILAGLDYHCPPGNEPKYRRLGRVLLASLRANNVPAGSKLPNDKELARRFNTAVMTMAHALNDLAAKGILERRVGAGTFVRVLNPENTATVRKIGILCHGTITMEGGFITALMHELFRQASQYSFDLIQLKRYPDEYLETVKSFDLHGVIVLSAEPEFLPQMAKLVNDGMNLVQLGMWYKEFAGFSFGTDHWQTTRQAIESLARLGHRKIGIFSGMQYAFYNHSSNIIRVECYQQTMNSLGLPVDPAWMIAENDFDDEKLSRFRKLIEQGKMPTAFLISWMPLAVKIYPLMDKLKLRIPEDVSLLALDDSFLSEQLSPGLTTLSQNIPELVSRVFQRLNRPEKSCKVTEPVPPLLIERASCSKIN